MNLTLTSDINVVLNANGQSNDVKKIILNKGWSSYTVYEKTIDYSKMYMTIESLEDSNEVKFNRGSSRNNNLVNISYSYDNGENWTSTVYNSVTWNLNAGDKVILRGGNYMIGSSSSKSYAYYFSSTKKFKVYGNLFSIFHGDSFIDKTAWPVSSNSSYTAQCGYLFSGCSKLLDASNLILPATSLTKYVYNNMFYGCTIMTQGPDLIASSTSEECYKQMFSGCKALNYIKCLATYLSATNALSSWTYNVSNTGTFVKAANATSWPSGTSGIPSGWTVIDA